MRRMSARRSRRARSSRISIRPPSCSSFDSATAARTRPARSSCGRASATKLNEAEVLKTLGASPHLALLDQSALVFLIRFGKMRTFAVGDALMRQGEPSTSIHFILEGLVGVERQRRTDSERVVLAQLGSGEIVGEMGVMVDLPRSATVIATKPTSTLELDTA